MTERIRPYHEEVAREKATHIIDRFRESIPSRGPNRHLFTGYLNRVAKRIDSSMYKPNENGVLVFTTYNSSTRFIIRPDSINWEWVVPGGPNEHDIEKSVEFSIDAFGRQNLTLGRKIGEVEIIAIVGDEDTATIVENDVMRETTIEEVNKLFPKPK